MITRGKQASESSKFPSGGAAPSPPLQFRDLRNTLLQSDTRLTPRTRFMVRNPKPRRLCSKTLGRYLIERPELVKRFWR